MFFFPSFEFIPSAVGHLKCKGKTSSENCALFSKAEMKENHTGTAVAISMIQSAKEKISNFVEAL